MSSVIASPVGRSNPEVRGLSPCNAGIASSRLLLAMTSTPTYTWNKVNGSTYYYLYVNGPSGNVISKWYTPAEANCDSASSTTCTITPTTTLANGSHTWWIQTWNPIGSGPWSNTMTFTVQSQGYAPKKVLAAPAVMDTVTATFQYDGDGKRVSQTINGVTTYFVGNYYEQTGDTVTKYYYAGASRIAMRTCTGGTCSAPTYLLSDHLGSTSIVTDSAGNQISEMRYDPWGKVRSGDATTEYTFTGQRDYTGEFGLMYFNARWVDVSLGRFAQADTVVPDGVQGLDRYAYANNSPLNYTDSSGHYPDGNAYWSISLTTNLSNSIPIDKVGAQYWPNGNSGLSGQYKNLCGDIALEMIYDAVTNSDAPLSQFYNSRPVSASGDVPTSANQLGLEFANSFPTGWTGTAYQYGLKFGLEAGNPNFTSYTDQATQFDQLSNADIESMMIGALGQGHYLVMLVTIDQNGGLLQRTLTDSDIYHWVAISGVAKDGITIVNPFTNRLERYSWNQYFSSFGYASVELTPPSNMISRPNFRSSPLPSPE